MNKLNDLACEMSALSFVIVNLKKKLNWILKDNDRLKTTQKLQEKQKELQELCNKFNKEINQLLE
tara:strand:+ start:159 stop:353 length:195 start_codon:yes stop_codon:yes gene_type:complete